MVVPCVPAHALGSVLSPSLIGANLPSKYLALYAHGASAVRVVMVTCATCVMLANASPRNPNVVMVFKSSNEVNLDVVKRSHTIGRSSFRMPWPLSWICNSCSPPPFTVTVMLVDPASKQFSSISLIAAEGRWTTSPAAIRFTTVSSSFRITGADIVKTTSDRGI